MPTVYIDSDFKCHTTNPDGVYRSVETDFFTGKCASFIEGYRYVPAGESWTRSDGVVFHGEMIAPCKDYDIISTAQALFEELDPSISEKDERIAALEKEKAMLTAQVSALSDQMDFYEACIVEMAEVVYA